MSRVWVLTARSSAPMPRERVAGSGRPLPSTWTQPAMALSGPRSSWDTVAMNSSLRRLALSAWRAALSSWTRRCSRSSAMRTSSVRSSMASRIRVGAGSPSDSRLALTTIVRRPSPGNSAVNLNCSITSPRGGRLSSRRRRSVTSQGASSS